MNLSISFHTFPIEIVSNILSKTDFEALKNLEYVSKFFNNTVKTMLDYTSNKEVFFIGKLMPEINDFPFELVKALGGARKIYQFPVIKLTDENYTGTDGGIITINSRNMLTNSVCRGLDKYDRPFIACAYLEKQGFITKKLGIMNIFKLNPSDKPERPNNWMCYKEGGLCFISNQKGAAVGDTISKIQNLFNKENRIDNKTTMNLDFGGTIFLGETIDNFLNNRSKVMIYTMLSGICFTNTAIQIYNGTTSLSSILIPLTALLAATFAIKIFKDMALRR